MSTTPLPDRVLVGGPPQVEPFPYEDFGTGKALWFCSVCAVYGCMVTCWYCNSKEHLTPPTELPFWLM